MSAEIWRLRRQDLDDAVNGVAVEPHTGEMPTVVISTRADRAAVGRLKAARIVGVSWLPGLQPLIDGVRRMLDVLP